MQDRRIHLACAWSFAVVGVLIVCGWWLLAGWIPPHAPQAGAGEIAGLYEANTAGIRAGMVLIMTAAAFLAPATAAFYVQLRRIEGPRAPLLSMTYALCGAFNIIGVTIPAAMWTVAAFRPDRDPQITQVFNDTGWVFWIMISPPVSIQCCAFGWAVLRDTVKPSLFPRWLGYFNLWTAFLFCPALLVTFFKEGPFAWNGLISFWMVWSVIAAYMIVQLTYLLKAIAREDSLQ